MSDPIADLVLEMQEQTVDQFTFLELAHVDVPLLLAEWLRANRDRVALLLYADDRDAALRAFGGTQDGTELRASSFLARARMFDRWLFPKGGGDQ